MLNNKDIEPFIKELKQLAESIQSSEALAIFQEEESDETYKSLAAEFEPALLAVHAEVANHFPLHLETFELEYLSPDMEGLFQPKLLGFSVLRGHFDSNYKYTSPQNHFKILLLEICQSPNFDFISRRIGQSVQIAFALSSDIWITNLIQQVENKKIKSWLESQKLEKYLKADERKAGLQKYKKQFASHNYYSSKIPHSNSELRMYYPTLKYFLFQRQRLRLDNSNIKPEIIQMLLDGKLDHTAEYDHILFILLNFFNLEGDDQKAVYKIFNDLRKESKTVSDDYFDFLLEMYENQTILGPDSDKKVKSFIDANIDDDIKTYYDLVDELHSKGFMHADVVEAIKVYINKFPGLSNQNEAVRQAVLRYLKEWIDNAEVSDYPDYFEFFKTYSMYMKLFDNQHFNHELKYSSMDYVKRLLKFYTDKRGKDYQDIKKFIASNFPDAGFMSEKQVVELFKTRRKTTATD